MQCQMMSILQNSLGIEWVYNDEQANAAPTINAHTAERTAKRMSQYL